MQSNNKHKEKNKVKIISNKKMLNHFCYGKTKQMYFKKTTYLTVCSLMMEEILSKFIIYILVTFLFITRLMYL